MYEYKPSYEAPEEQDERGIEKSKDLWDMQYTTLWVAFGRHGFVKEGFSLSYGMRLQGISCPRNSLAKLALSCLVSMEYSDAFKDFRFSDVNPPRYPSHGSTRNECTRTSGCEK